MQTWGLAWVRSWLQGVPHYWRSKRCEMVTPPSWLMNGPGKAAASKLSRGTRRIPKLTNRIGCNNQSINQPTNQSINQSIINPYGWCMTLLSQHFNVCTCRLWIFAAKEIPFVVWTSLLVAFSPRPWVSKLTSGWWKMCSSDIETRFSKCLRLGRSTGFGNPGFEQTSADHHVWISFFHAVAGHPPHLASGSVNWFYRFLK